MNEHTNNLRHNKKKDYHCGSMAKSGGHYTEWTQPVIKRNVSWSHLLCLQLKLIGTDA